jgi:hypothetical protein
MIMNKNGKKCIKESFSFCFSLTIRMALWLLNSIVFGPQEVVGFERSFVEIRLKFGDFS